MLRSVYGKIVIFPKKENTFRRWQDGKTFEEIARLAGVAVATSQIYVIDMIASGSGKPHHRRLARELEIQHDSFADVHEMLCRGSISLREIKDSCNKAKLSYNQIRAIIALLMNGYEL